MAFPIPTSVERWDEKGKGKIVKKLQDGLMVPDILNTCKFFMYADITLEHLADLYSAMTGWEVSGEDLMTVGERVLNLQRMFNVREGYAHERMTSCPKGSCSSLLSDYYEKEAQCAIVNFDDMLDEYYETRKWDKKTGMPSEEKLKELGLEML